MRSRGGRWARDVIPPEPLPAPAVELAPVAVEVAAPRSAIPARGQMRAVVVTLRPRQWIKNLLVIAAAGAAGALGHDDVPVRVGLAFIAFCLLASGVYAVNDVRDAAEDRQHPRKRNRPVAAGQLDARAALALGAALVAAGLTLCLILRPLLLLVGAGYVALTLSYTVLWRRIVILDVLAIACGFVLRAVAGGVAAPVTLSRWFVAVVTFSALFVAAGKRLAELRRTNGTELSRRGVLRFYNGARLRAIVIASAALALFAYCVWAFELPSVGGIPWRPLTIIPFTMCVARYVARVQTGDGEAPEELVLRDRWIQLAGIAWLIVFALGVHAAG
jgi:decaprenyl-phosphate phosphoribosyltransferase